MLSTVSDPQEITPFTPVIDRLGAESVPSTEAPLLTAWERAGTRFERLAMLAETAAAAVAMLTQRLSVDTRDVLSFVVM